MSIFRRARVKQIQFCSRQITRLSRVPLLFAVLKRVRELPIVRPAMNAVVGYRRPFPTFADASAAIAAYEGGGHSNATYIERTIRNGRIARLSDYPALFHIQHLLPQLRTVFDLGGGPGNTFFCYSKYLDMPRDLTWRVLDLPEQRRIGTQLAKERNEHRLDFAVEWGNAEGVDLLITTGALHCFEKSLPSMISELRRKPRHVLINRAALVDCPPFASVQDGEVYRLACFLYNRNDLIREFESLGYELVDSWPAPEPGHFVSMPFYPDRSVMAYSGLFLRLNAPGDAPVQQRCEDRLTAFPASA
jgi:putative methyltransferase (TIGR04325 family)